MYFYWSYEQLHCCSTVETTLVCMGLFIVDCTGIQSLGNNCAFSCAFSCAFTDFLVYLVYI